MQITRTIPLTGRKKISKKHIKLKLTTNADGILNLGGQIDFSGTKLPGEAHVFAHPYFAHSMMRFSCGTVENTEIPDVALLTELDSSSSVLCRILVVDPSDEQIILASAERIRLLSSDDEDDESAEALITVKPFDLVNSVWELELDEALPKPLLKINKRITNGLDLVAGNGIFHGLLLPAIIRLVFGYIFQNELQEEGGNSDDVSWYGNWIRFAEKICGEEIPKEGDNIDNEIWIRNVVDSFSQEHNLMNSILKGLEQEGHND